MEIAHISVSEKNSAFFVGGVIYYLLLSLFTLFDFKQISSSLRSGNKGTKAQQQGRRKAEETIRTLVLRLQFLI